AASSPSPAVYRAAPSRSTSLIKNCPTGPDSTGKPPRLGSHPGVVIRNVSGVRNIPAASPLPVADPSSHTGRVAMSTPLTVPTTPSSAANWPTLITPYPCAHRPDTPRAMGDGGDEAGAGDWAS